MTDYIYSINDSIRIVRYTSEEDMSAPVYPIDLVFRMREELDGTRIYDTDILSEKLSLSSVKEWIETHGGSIKEDQTFVIEREEGNERTDSVQVLQGAYDLSVSEIFSRVIYGSKVWNITAEMASRLLTNGPELETADGIKIPHQYEYVILQLRKALTEILQDHPFIGFLKECFAESRYIVFETCLSGDDVSYCVFFNDKNLDDSEDILLFNLVQQENPFIEFVTDLPFETIFRKLSGQNLSDEREKERETEAIRQNELDSENELDDDAEELY